MPVSTFHKMAVYYQINASTTACVADWEEELATHILKFLHNKAAAKRHSVTLVRSEGVVREPRSTP